LYSIKFLEEALFDIEEIVLWYEEKRIGLSFDFELCLEAGINEVLRNPDSFQNKYKNFKIRYIERFPYGIHYIKKEEVIIILGVFNTSRSPKNWKKRIVSQNKK
jgi:toxin ParE1/3/4